MNSRGKRVERVGRVKVERWRGATLVGKGVRPILGFAVTALKTHAKNETAISLAECTEHASVNVFKGWFAQASEYRLRLSGAASAEHPIGFKRYSPDMILARRKP